MHKYRCKIEGCDAKYHPEEGCAFDDNTKKCIRSARNDWCIYRATHVKKYLEEIVEVEDEV